MHNDREAGPTARRLAGLALAAATFAACLAGAQAAGGQAGELRFGPNYRQGTDQSASRGRDVPGLAVDPADPNHVVSVDVDYINGECSFKTSFDGGATWPYGGNFDAPAGWPDPPCLQNFDSGGYAHGDATVVFGAGQNVYTAFSSHRGPYQRPESAIIAGTGDDSLVVRSTDGGRTFQTAVPAIVGGPASQPFNIRPQVAVQRGAGTGGQDRVYVNAWRCQVISGGCSGGQDIRQMWAARSDDGGQTWGAPVQVSNPVNANASISVGEQTREPSQPVVDPRNGWVYMAWRNRDPVTLAIPRNTIVVARSTDLGATWQRFNAGTLANSTNATAQVTTGATGSGGHPRLAIDPTNGNLYVAYQDGQLAASQSDQDILFVRSTDGGQTWSAPVRVNDDTLSNGFNQQQPRVEVAPDGRVDVVWFDRRNSARLSTLGDIYYASSSDGGQTFSANRRVTDRHLNTNVGLTAVGGYTWYGPVMAARGTDHLLVAWTDSREGNYNNGIQDIYLSDLDLRSAGPGVQRLPDASTSGLAVAMGRLAYPGGLESANNLPASKPVIVSDADPVLAMVGAPLARVNLAPLLVSPPSRLGAAAQAEIARMEAPGAFVVGSEAAVGPGVVGAVTGAGVPADAVVRLSGSSPADTARLVALAMDQRTAAQKASGSPAVPAVVVVNPAAPESVGVVGLASSLGVPILLTDQGSVPQATRDAIAALNVTTTLVAGSAGAVSDAVLGSLPGAKRLAGGDASAMSVAAAAEAKARRLPTNVAYVGDSDLRLDPSLLATASGRNGGVLVLVPGADQGAAEQALAGLGLRPTVDRLVIARSSAALNGQGYRLAARDGGVFAFGRARFFGSTGGMKLNKPVVGMASTATDLGYWLVASDGGVFAFGDAAFKGSTGALRLAKPVVGMAPTPSGKGYWLVASDGGVFAFGDAKFYGSTGAIKVNQPIVGIAPTPSGKGYWLVAADGGIFAYGDAAFAGSTGAMRLNKPVVGMAATATGRGYWLAASDGGIFAFGDAAFAGSTGGMRLNQPVVGMDVTAGTGYWLVAADGGVFAFGDATFAGSTGGMTLNQPVVAVGASR